MQLAPNPPHDFKPALVDRAALLADIQQRADGRFAHAADRHARFQFGDPRVQHFLMQRILGRPAQRLRARGIDADRRLQRGEP